jgi:hypothetical protein
MADPPVNAQVCNAGYAWMMRLTRQTDARPGQGYPRPGADVRLRQTLLIQSAMRRVSDVFLRGCVLT